jgi:hypothetical protein
MGKTSPKLVISKAGETGEGSKTYPSVGFAVLGSVGFWQDSMQPGLAIAGVDEPSVGWNLAFFDSSESGTNLLPLHLLFMVPYLEKDA